MRAVADTNVVVSGLLWNGPPRRILDPARAGSVELFTSLALLIWLEDVLSRPKFLPRLAAAGVSARELVTGYVALARVLAPTPVGPAIAADPDDDEILACAVAARAEVMVSGDRHLRALGSFQGIWIATAAELLQRL